MKKETRGMIMALDSRYATVLTPDGQFLKVKKPSEPCFIGDEIAFTAQTWSWSAAVSRAAAAFRRPVLQGAVAMSALLFAGLGSWAYPMGHVYMDVNPSISLTYNVYHRVIGTESFNEDGQKIISAINIYGKTLEDSVAESLRVMDQQGYVKSGEAEISGVILGYSDEAAESEALAGVSKAAEAVAKPVTVATVKVSDKVAKAAKAAVKEAVKTTPIKAAIVSETKDKHQNEETMEEQSTAEIIQSNREALKVIKDERLEKIKAEIEAKKQRLREAAEQLKKQEEQRKQQEELKKNQEEDKKEQEESIEKQEELNKQGKPLPRGQDKPKPKDQDKEKPKDQDKEKPKDQELQETEENQDSPDASEGEESQEVEEAADQQQGQDAQGQQEQAEKLKRLEAEIQQVKDQMEAVRQTELPPKEKEKLLKALEKQLERLKKLKERIQ